LLDPALFAPIIADSRPSDKPATRILATTDTTGIQLPLLQAQPARWLFSSWP